MRKIAALIAGLALALVPTAASAHSVDIYNGADTAHMGSEHRSAWIHDKECDGNYAYVVVHVLIPGPEIATASQWDHNGCGSDGGTRIDDIWKQDIFEFRICERYKAGLEGDACSGTGNPWHAA